MTSNEMWTQAVEKLNRAESDVVLDFSSMRRIDTQGVRALEELAVLAEEKSVKPVLRAVNMDVYRVLKLLRLTERFNIIT
jgi:anti-anti-sigma regulatory factor